MLGGGPQVIADRTEASLVFRRLLDGFAQSGKQHQETRWRWLTAAHIVGQQYLGLHVASHVAMLKFAARNGDWREVSGQLFRLALVPLGHLSSRLPAGNIGRATVNAFIPMPVDPISQALIETAQSAVAEDGGSLSGSPVREFGAERWRYLFTAWLISLVSSLAVLFIGEVMGRSPCDLCWFQRAFMFPMVLVLGVACQKNDPGGWRYALPLALAGLGLSIFHLLLYVGAVAQSIQACGQGPSCTGDDMALFGIPIPLYAAFAFGAISVLLMASRGRAR